MGRGFLRIVHVEGNARDAGRVAESLRQGGVVGVIDVVTDEAAFVAALDGADVVLSDFTASAFGGTAALKVAQRRRPEVPFLFVSDTREPAAAIEGLVAGAVDYVLKKDLHRLASAVMRAAREGALRRERRRAEEELGQTRRLLQALMDNTASGVSVKDREGRYVFLNRHAAADLAVNPQQAIGRVDEEFLGPDFPTYREAEERVWARGLSEEVEEVARGTLEPRTDLVQRFLLREGDAEPYALGTIRTDITQFRRLEEQLRQSQKMEAIGQLAGGIAHDFNNLLTAILGYSDLLAGLATDENLKRLAGETRRAAERAASLTRQLLAFSRKQALDLRVIDLNARVAEMEDLLRRLIGEHIQLETSLFPGLGRVWADAGQIEQIILNLAVNARDAMPDGGTLSLSTREVSAAECPPEAEPGTYVLLEVRDTGRGMDEGTRSRIFEPFFTTKEPGKGTGLGLATVYGIVNQAGGHVSVDSVLHQGAAFRIYLPRVGEALAESLDLSIDPAAATGGTETLLLVEDDDLTRALASEILTQAGYTVIQAADGHEALHIGESDPRPIHLMITDVVLPQVSGPDLVRRLRPTRPAMRVLLVSGYASPERSTERLPLLPKPFSPSDLLRMVREVLEQPETNIPSGT